MVLLKELSKKIASRLLYLIIYYKVYTLLLFLYIPKNIFRHFLCIFWTLNHCSHMTISNG